MLTLPAHDRTTAVLPARTGPTIKTTQSCGKPSKTLVAPWSSPSKALPLTLPFILPLTSSATKPAHRSNRLTCAGSPDDSLCSAGGLGNAKRVGHDISPHWESMTSLVDIGRDLWMYAHNSTNPKYGGWWNDLDMIEVGNGPDFKCEENDAALARCRAHFTMWTIMKVTGV